eukprot:4318744-Pyramimonas_sp.AAC.1
MRQADAAVYTAWVAFIEAAEAKWLNGFDVEPRQAEYYRGRGSEPQLRTPQPPRPCSVPFPQINAEAT